MTLIAPAPFEKFPVKEVHISTIKGGDTVIHNGEVATVSGTNIKQDSFMGTTLFGDSYKLGHKLAAKVIL
jgi:IS4 transposase